MHSRLVGATLALALIAAVAVAMTLNAGPTQTETSSNTYGVATPVSAQPPPPSPAAYSRFVDVSLESLPAKGILLRWVITVRNNLHGATSGSAVWNVKVQLVPKDIVPYASFIGAGNIDPETGIWTIPRIAPGGSVEANFQVGTLHRFDGFDEYPSYGDLTPVRLHATLTDVTPNESVGFEQNNTTEEWYIHDAGSGLRRGGTMWTFGDAGVNVTTDDSLLREGEVATFGVLAVNQRNLRPALRDTQYRLGSSLDTQFGVKVEIELSEGLQFAPGLQPPEGTTFDDTTMTWNASTVTLLGWPSLDVPVTVTTSPPLEEVPLERRCLTAKLVEAVPDFEFSPHRRANDVSTACLGQRPVVIASGEIILWWQHDCVNIASWPCGEENELKLFATAVDYSARSYYLEPESLVVHIPDQVGRGYDDNDNSVTSGSTVSWQTGRKDSGAYNRGGLRVFYSRAGFNDNINDWQNIVRTVSVSGLDRSVPPGRVKVRHDSSTASTFYNPAPPSYTHERAPFTLRTITNVHND